MLNGLWLGFFLIAALAALGRWLVGGDPAVFAANVLTIAVPEGNPAGVTGLADLAREVVARLPERGPAPRG